VLDKTAFFPEEGGQSSDNGRIGDAVVSYVYEMDGVVHHLTDIELPIGEYNCSIDFDARFEKMQCHTAEHILCGIIHRLYGLDNVGFHLGDDEVTFDVNGQLDRSQLNKVEELANNVVFSNLMVESIFPTSDELKDIQYRAKLDLTEGVRIVRIAGVDSCACCAPHVSRTGEIGLIKILDFMKHRGGTRIWMVAGKRALLDYRSKYDNVKRISAMLCAPQPETADTLENYIKDSENAKLNLKAARIKIAELEAEGVNEINGNVVFLLSDFTIPELIAFSNIAGEKISGITVALSGNDGDYKYVISSKSVDLRSISKEINSTLSGRGGGRPEMIQGSFGASFKEIQDYFK
jgi:alanyl-tRNA synthetase